MCGRYQEATSGFDGYGSRRRRVIFVYGGTMRRFGSAQEAWENNEGLGKGFGPHDPEHDPAFDRWIADGTMLLDGMERPTTTADGQIFVHRCRFPFEPDRSDPRVRYNNDIPYFAEEPRPRETS